MEALHGKIRDSPSTRRVYCEINPNLSVNVMYSKDCVAPENGHLGIGFVCLHIGYEWKLEDGHVYPGKNENVTVEKYKQRSMCYCSVP